MHGWSRGVRTRATIEVYLRLLKRLQRAFVDGTVEVARRAWLVAMFTVITQTASAAIPDSERQVLINLYTSTNGTSWTTSTNWNGAAGTECTWYGVTCDSTDSHVTRLDLNTNHLTGSLSALQDLKSLNFFSVGTNQLTGTIPNLSGLTDLFSFNAASNQLSGSIPTLTGLTNLDAIFLAHNQLTGSLPALTGLSNLRGIAVNNNQLSGSLPTLMGLTNLMYFYAYNNQLTGSLPSFDGLPNVQSFYVYNNRLNGPIPDMSGFATIQTFNVSFNQLTGAVPVAPASLVSGGSSLCPNLLDTAPTANDSGWNMATGDTPWWATPHSTNVCDDIFSDGFE